MKQHSDVTGSPAKIYKYLTDYAELVLKNSSKKNDLEIILDIHWIYLHARNDKKRFNYKKHVGKWKYKAGSKNELLEKVKALVPLVATKKLHVVKFTNMANVFNDENLLVVYCFPFGPSSIEIKNLLIDNIGEEIFWGSYRFPEP